MNTRDLTKMALFVALLCVSAYISFPLPFSPVPVTALTLVYLLLALTLTPKQTLIVGIVYTALGAVGLPVFTNGTGGLAKLVGPTAGYIWGFLLAYPLVSMFKGQTKNFLRYAAVAILISIPVTYATGVAGLMIVTKMPFEKALAVGVLPFIPGDIIKAVVAAWLASKIKI